MRQTRNQFTMKYPENQFDVLVEVLETFKQLFDLEKSNVHTLHFRVFQQFSEGQKHNAIYKNGTTCKLHHALSAVELKEYEPLINIDFDFELYPHGCNDNHVETAMKKAIKKVLN